MDLIDTERGFWVNLDVLYAKNLLDDSGIVTSTFGNSAPIHLEINEC